MTLQEFLNAYPDVDHIRTLPPKQQSLHSAHEIHYVTPRNPRKFRGPIGAEDRIKEGQLISVIVVQNHPQTWPYDMMPRFWRERMFPDGFRRWTEAEHVAKRTPYTWQQQQTVWARRDIAEAWIDGEMDAAERDRLLAEMDSVQLPSLPWMVANQVQKMTVRPKPERHGPSEDVLLAAVTPVPLPEPQPVGAPT